MWGNDPGVNSALIPPPPLNENWINPKAPKYSTQTLGWGRRLSGPNDGATNDIQVGTVVMKNAPDSSCMSCHSPAEWQPDQPPSRCWDPLAACRGGSGTSETNRGNPKPAQQTSTWCLPSKRCPCGGRRWARPTNRCPSQPVNTAVDRLQSRRGLTNIPAPL